MTVSIKSTVFICTFQIFVYFQNLTLKDTHIYMMLELSRFHTYITLMNLTIQKHYETSKLRFRVSANLGK